MSVGQYSLFNAPVPASSAEQASSWITSLLGGSAATALCIIAVAILGLLMLGGRLPIRRGVQIVLGCFLLLGSSALAFGLGGFARDTADNGSALLAGPVVIETDEQPLEPAEYNPYARASVRVD